MDEQFKQWCDSKGYLETSWGDTSVTQISIAHEAWMAAYSLGLSKGRKEGMIEAQGRKVRPVPVRELARCGTGGLHGEQQYCFEKGWREGQAALRKAIRQAAQVGEGGERASF